MRDLILIGGGEHARVIIDAALESAEPWNVVGFLDARDCDDTVARFHVPRLASDDAAEEIVRRFPDARFVIGVGAIGRPELRAGIACRFNAIGAKWATVIHRDASVSPTAAIGEGTVVFARSVINTGAAIGSHCVINTAAVIEHDVALGDYTQASPAAAIGGGAVIGSGSYLGLGCRVRDHVRIGNRVMVGMGAVVTNDIGDGVEVIGVPARPRKVNV